jgi:hypothetical protein
MLPAVSLGLLFFVLCALNFVLGALNLELLFFVLGALYLVLFLGALL